MKTAVLGAGNGGRAMAVHLALNGHRVSVYDKYEQALSGIREAGGINRKGVLGDGFTPVESASPEMEEVVSGARLIMVVTPAFAHREIMQQLCCLLQENQVVVLHPGRTGGALECREVLRQLRSDLKAVIAEAQTLLYASRATGETEVTIYGIKKEVAVSSLPAAEIGNVRALLDEALPGCFKAAGSVLETSLLNIGAVFHPAPTILNAARIEEEKGVFEYYHGGISPSVARVLEALDDERVRIARALNVPTLSAVEWIEAVYGTKGNNLYEAIRQNAVYSGIKAPGDLRTRYITEDVPMSLVPLAELGRLAGVDTPVMDCVIRLAELMHGTPYRKLGRTLEKMGIRGMTVEELRLAVC
ncbi:MAG: NAD/NADP octopine/nopaline dehydrogenase family protein [Peptococcaceae bacterium]|jgi:opine dehydrogenase|nr:NAD/NADP octopine/nopaline dehydrogenase family protein [Peptococcaceae bacterium]MDH7523929.1 NAD/NADP octopine/nopaline dehydrogenase family protein [Peptococcaceae bacterium]